MGNAQVAPIPAGCHVVLQGPETWALYVDGARRFVGSLYRCCAAAADWERELRCSP